LLLAGSAVICAVASSTSIILIVLNNPDSQIPVIGPVTVVLPVISPLTMVLFVFAVAFGLFAVLLMLVLYETSRRLDHFNDYKAELEQQWGPIGEKTPKA
jgi:hypothetical protein